MLNKEEYIKKETEKALERGYTSWGAAKQAEENWESYKREKMFLYKLDCKILID